MNSGLSKWSHEQKKDTKRGIVYVASRPMLCDCGGTTPIGGNAGDVASFFYVDLEWICLSCGRVLEPTIRDYETNEQEL